MDGGGLPLDSRTRSGHSRIDQETTRDETNQENAIQQGWLWDGMRGKKMREWVIL